MSFADGYPLLLISRASLDDLNARLAEPVGIERFRPNIVVEGSEAYAEDGWSRIVIGGMTLEGAKRRSGGPSSAETTSTEPPAASTGTPGSM